jgi:TIR domain
MSLRKNTSEVQRLIAAFEQHAATFNDISFSVFVVASDREPPQDKFLQPNHAITLWQYYGTVGTELERSRLLQHDTNWGVRGAKLSLIGVIQGSATPLFVRMAKRAGSLFNRKEVDAFKLQVLDDILNKEASSRTDAKPVGIVNSNPLAVWLNYLLYHLSLPRIDITRVIPIEPEPFSLSLLALEKLLTNSQIARSDRSTTPIADIKFKVALSFPGERRRFVDSIAGSLREALGADSVFYDLDYQAQLARPNLDTLLQDVYSKNSELIVVFLSAEYSSKEWCGLEWRAIREIIKQRRSEQLMLVRFDDSSIDGVFSHDGYIDARRHDEDAVVGFILSRLKSMKTLEIK